MYDFHAHVLPCVDHGSRSLEESERQIALLRASGVTHVVCAPHFYPDEWSGVESFLSHRKGGEEMLLPLLETAGVTLYAAAEVLVSEGLENLEELASLCIAGTNILLLEMPFFRWNERLLKSVERIMRSGLCVMLAHVDRYPKKDVEKLFRMGAVGQVNCEAFARVFRRRTYREWVKNGFVCALGSDIHSPEKFRQKELARAEKYLGAALNGKLQAFGKNMLAKATPLAK